jgi:hypothetical protein
MTRKCISEACSIACQNSAVYSVSPSVMTSHSKIAQFYWQYIGLTAERITLEMNYELRIPTYFLVGGRICLVSRRSLLFQHSCEEAEEKHETSKVRTSAFPHYKWGLLKVKIKLSRIRPGVAQRVPEGLGSRIFMTFGIWRWWDCQSHTPAAFTQRNFPGSHSH